MTPKEKSTLIKAGIGVGALVWAGPQILGMLFVLLFLGLFAGLVVLAMAGTLLKYALLIGAGIAAVTVLGRLIRGPKRRAEPSPLRAAERQKRLSRAALDLELLKAQRAAAERR